MTTDFSAELYSDAIAIEHEAAKRYAELGERMADCGNHAVAALFRLLARLEGEHLAELQRRTSGIRLPALAVDHSWPSDAAPETIEVADSSISQRAALSLALEAERKARAFFEQASRVADDPDGRVLANEMALEEAHHEKLIRRMLDVAP